MTTLLELRGIGRRFSGAVKVSALDGVSLDIEAGEFFAIVGPSGGGKSTLLNTIGLLDRPSSGDYSIAGEATGSSSAKRLAQIRSATFGFVFQSFHLLEQRPVIDSVELGLVYRAVPPRVRRERALQALADVGLENLADQKALKLSGGQRQRVAIARALTAGAPVIIADEPTGNLDSQNGKRVVESLLSLAARGTTVVLVTHDPEIAAVADRIGHIKDGRIDRIDVRSRADVMSAPTQAPPASEMVGSASRLTVRDTLRDAIGSIASRPGKSAGLVAAVATAVALAVTTAGISLSAASQVSDRFDLHANRDVSVSWQSGTETDDPVEGSATSPKSDEVDEIRDRLKDLRGVESVGVLANRGTVMMQATPVRAALQAPIATITAGVVPAARLGIRWLPNHRHTISPGEIVIGRSLAAQLSLGALADGPTVRAEDTDLRVVGVIDTSPRLPTLLGTVVTSWEGIAGLEQASVTTALLRTSAGAAAQVAHQAPLAVDPFRAESLEVDAPRDPSSLRDEVQSDVQSTLVAFTVVALLAAVIALANAMVLAVLERRREFGLRRAIGARPVHVSALVLAESVALGAGGGVAGLAFGLGSILTITLARHWVPVFDLRLAPAALVGGVVVGTLGGVFAALRASRIEPHDALRL